MGFGTCIGAGGDHLCWGDVCFVDVADQVIVVERRNNLSHPEEVVYLVKLNGDEAANGQLVGDAA